MRIFILIKYFYHRDEAVQMSGMPTAKNSIEMENHVFQKAKTKVCCYSFRFCLLPLDYLYKR